MPRGSPDFTDRIYQEHCRYDNVIDLLPLAVMPVWPAWQNVVTYNGAGSFGYLWLTSSDPCLYCRVTLDGVVIFLMHAANLVDLGLWSTQSCWPKMGVSRYDAIDDKYRLFYDEQWAMVFNTSLVIDVSYEIAHAGNGGGMVWYKVLHP